MYAAIQEMRDERGERLILHSPNIVNLCIDSYDEEKQCGRLYHQYTDHTVFFSSLFEALDRMERLYDEIQFPRAATRLRSFMAEEDTVNWCDGAGGIREGIVPQEGPAVPEEGKSRNMTEVSGKGRVPEGRETFEQVIGHRGEDATFIIRVQYRQHSSWQGEVTWMDGRRRLPFRSVLELARLIDNTMNVTGREAAEPGKRFRADGAGKQEGKWSRGGSGVHENA